MHARFQKAAPPTLSTRSQHIESEQHGFLPQLRLCGRSGGFAGGLAVLRSCGQLCGLAGILAVLQAVGQAGESATSGQGRQASSSRQRQGGAEAGRRRGREAQEAGDGQSARQAEVEALRP
ncbi:hypothetical protein GGX14DRAFT_398175 [Mycena pura]|uniref:Uncharacterized protein n=1 Tax=Mycena pura TaxID=153505 RepID=A0AAD6YC14_9AGAR|nr:hypothetical protein GGX14DRAFT_398175 [Mycena pura]